MRPRLGQVADRPHQGLSRCGRPDQGGPGPAPQGHPPHHQSPAAAQRDHPGQNPLLHRHRKASLGFPFRSAAPGGGQCLRFRRFQLPHHPGRVPAERPPGGLGRQHPDPPLFRQRQGRTGSRTGQHRRRHGLERPAGERGTPAQRLRPRRTLPAGTGGGTQPQQPEHAVRQCPFHAAHITGCQLEHPGRRLVRRRPGSRHPRHALPRPGGPVQRHAAGPGLQLSPDAGRHHRRRRGLHHPGRPAPVRPDLPPARLRSRRQRAPGTGAARHRRGPAGHRRRQPGRPAAAALLRHRTAGGGRPQLRRTDRPVRGRRAGRAGLPCPFPSARPADGGRKRRQGEHAGGFGTAGNPGRADQ